MESREKLSIFANFALGHTQPPAYFAWDAKWKRIIMTVLLLLSPSRCSPRFSCFLSLSPPPRHRSIQFPTLHQNSLRRPNPKFLSFLFEARTVGICSFSFPLPSPSSLNSAKQPLHGLFGKEREGKKNGLSESKAGGDCTLHTHLGCMQERRRERSLDLSIRGAFVFSFYCRIQGRVFSWYTRGQ